MAIGGRATTVETETSAAPGQNRAWIAVRDLAEVGQAIEALSERGRRFGTGPIELRELRRHGGDVLVEFCGEPPRMQGWEVVGRLEHRNGGPGRLSFATSGVNRGAWARAEPWCEHCGLLRRRTFTYLVRDSGGEVRQIGSSCLRDYTGHDLARALRQTELLGKCSAAVRPSARGPESGDSERPGLEGFLALVVGVVREEQRGTFVPRSRSSEANPASADLALNAWRSGQCARTTDQESSRDLIAWGLARLKMQRNRSEYEGRVMRLIERGGRLSKAEARRVAGLYLLEERWRTRSFLGPVGARIDVQVEVQVVRPTGRNRFGEVIWHGMRDGRNRWASWFTSGGRRLNEGESYRLGGRVRRHGKWRGRPVTVLSRCVAHLYHRPAPQE